MPTPPVHSLFIGADNDSDLTYEEKITPYAERWNAVMNGAENIREPGGQVRQFSGIKNEMLKVIEREAMAGFKPSDQFKDEPFRTIDKLMTEVGINENTIREFLRWRSRKGNAVEIEVVPTVEPAGKKETREKLRQAMKRGHQFFG